MANTVIDPSELGKALKEQLTIYHEDVVEEVNEAGLRSIKKLVKLTKASAPIRTGDFADSLTYTQETEAATGTKTYTWGAAAPHHRLTHLLVHGHPTANGDRVDGDPFLQNALDTVLPEYEKDVEEAINAVK